MSGPAPARVTRSIGCSSARRCRSKSSQEFENWRKIRDWQGASGWVHQSLLSGKRSFIIANKAASLHKTPASSAEVVAKLEPEVMGEIRSCTGDWCRVKVSGVSGWIERTGMWGVYKSEPIN
jgi:SH3-like domain-containing protein